MAWKDYSISTGDVVQTPHGTGKVRRVSEQGGYAHVDVNGQLFETPLSDISKNSGKQDPVTGAVPEGAQMSDPKPEGQFQVGDKVKVKGNGRTATVSDVTQRTVKIKYTKNQKQEHGYAKKTAGEKLEKIDGGQQDPKQDSNQPEDQKPEDKTPEPTPEEKSTAQNLHGLLGLQKHMEDIIDEKVDEELKEIREIAKTKQKMEITINNKVVKIEGLKHKQLEQLISYSALRLNPLLVGMAGTGKTHAGEQVSEALKLPFYAMSVGAQTSKSDIIGYMSASGEYVSTHFRQAYENGGVFLMDEIDAGNANVLIQVNAGLSNNLMAFPDRMVKRHEDFVFIASANTYGNGANRQYVGRNQLDAATLDRFAVIDWLIDDELESSLTTGRNGKAWYMAVKAARDYVADKNIRALVSPRATQKGSKLLDIGQDLNEVIDATLLASVPDDKRPDVREVATKIFNKFASQVPKDLPAEVDPPSVKDLIQ